VSVATSAKLASSSDALHTTQASCIYEGSVRHRRLDALHDEFHHQLCMLYLDLDELPKLFDRHALWSARRPAPAWFRRADYLGDSAMTLHDAVKLLVRERTRIELDGPIRLLTHVRVLGHCFNPVSFYYCFDADGEHVRAVVAEVTNTPWSERHAYVLAVTPVDDEANAAGPRRVIHGEFEKALHVSPLMSMDHIYDWRLTEPGERLSVHIESSRADSERERVFDATLSLARRPLNAPELRRLLVRHPLPTLRLTARIYAHALRLRLRGAQWHAHPDGTAARRRKADRP
jgi:hypothetical protein